MISKNIHLIKYNNVIDLLKNIFINIILKAQSYIENVALNKGTL